MIFVVSFEILSAFLVNDTIVLIDILLVVYISKQVGNMPLVLLIPLALVISVGSTMTPIGNPQNLLMRYKVVSHYPLPLYSSLNDSYSD
jgi:Na+/H+ antiporter NhaD/arsenite permease-like protein